MQYVFLVLFCLLILAVMYLLTIRLYWSARFAIYRLVDFARSRRDRK